MRIRYQAIRVAKCRMYAPSMCFIYTRAAIFGVRERNQIVHHKNRTNVTALQRTIIAEVLHTIVTCMQQYRSFEAFAMRSQHAPSNQRSDGRAAGHWSPEHVESVLRFLSAKRFGIAKFTQNSAGLRMVSLNICKADAIHACRVQAVGQTGKQAGDV
ncbi:hypothetical protein WJ14_21355 [Burkholderia cenocepacia]|nr:hypothetical protein WJ14_21355 [Burkholderia cenocepacia]